MDVGTPAPKRIVSLGLFGDTQHPRHQFPQEIVRAVHDDEMVAALEAHEFLMRRGERREIFLGEHDRGLLILRAVEEEHRDREIETQRRQIDRAQRAEQLSAGEMKNEQQEVRTEEF